MSQPQFPPVKLTQRLAVRFTLTLALFSLAILLLLGSGAWLVQQQQRQYRAVALGLQTALLTEQLGQTAEPAGLDETMTAIGDNLARLRAGDAAGDLPVPGAVTEATLVAAQQEQASAATSLATWLATPEAESARSAFAASLTSLANSLTAVTAAQQRELDRASAPLLILIPLALLLALVALVLLLFQGRRLFRQQARLADTLALATAGDFTARTAVLHPDETGRIATQINTLLAQLQLAQAADEQQAVWATALSNLLADIDRIAAGDLREGADETAALTGTVAGAVNALLNQFRNLIGHVQTTTTAIRLAAGEAQQAANELTSTQGSQERELSFVRRELGSLKTSLESAAARAGQADKLGADIYTLSQQNRAAIDEALAQMEALRHSRRSERWQSQQLTTAAEAINQVGELAGNFAERVNILALNSSVQAATAGPEGQRLGTFAVELEQLAEQASELARQASVTAERAQAAATEAAAGLDATATISSTTGSAQQARQALSSISALSQEFAAVADNLRADLEEELELTGNLLGICSEIAARLPGETAATQTAVQAINQAVLHAEELRASLAGYKLPAGTRNGRHKV